MKLKTKTVIVCLVLAIVAAWYMLGIIKLLLPVGLVVALYIYVKRWFSTRKSKAG